MRNKKFLILGAYGVHNIGDEAMLGVLVDYLRAKFPGAEITCNSADPKHTAEVFGIKTFSTNVKKNPLAMLRAFLRSDVYLYGGGSLLVELRMNPLGRRTPLYRAILINALGRLLGKRVLYVGVGAEELTPGWSRLLVRLAVSLCNKCYLRDAKSYQTLRGYGCDAGKLEQGAELVFLMHAAAATKRDHIKRVCIMPVYRILGYDKYHEQYKTAIREAVAKLREQGKEVAFFAMQLDPADDMGDRQIISSITGKAYTHPVKGQLQPAKFIEWLSNFDLVLSSRYHGIVCMLINGLPAVSLTQFEKSDALLRGAGLERLSLDSADITGSKLEHVIEDIDANYQSIAEQVVRERDKLREKASNMMNRVANDINN